MKTRQNAMNKFNRNIKTDAIRTSLKALIFETNIREATTSKPHGHYLNFHLDTKQRITPRAPNSALNFH